MPKHKDFSISIPYPRPTANLYRGYKYIEAPKLNARTFRISDDEYDLARQAAQAIGISVSEFLRWCSYHCAIEVVNEVERQTFDAPKNNEPDFTGYS